MMKRIAFAGVALATVVGASMAVADDGPSDMQIAHIAYTAGNLDIRYAHLALAISNNAGVREFAELMLRDHAAVNDQALSLLKKLNAKPEDNSTSRWLTDEAEKKLAELSKLRGVEFDRSYAANELAYHNFVNETVEGTFIPAVDNEEFKGLLRQALTVFKVHEAHAKMMVDELR